MRLLRLFPIVLICSAFIDVTIAKGQNILTSTIIWDADEVNDQQVISSVQYSCLFKTNGTTMEWIQKKGEIKTEYAIVAHEGSWTDVSKNGNITFTLERKDRRSKMIIERTGTEVYVTFDFSNPGETPAIKKFHIKSIH